MNSSLVAGLIAATRFSVAINKTANGWKHITTDYDSGLSIMEDGFITRAHAQAAADREIAQMRGESVLVETRERGAA